MRSHLLWTVPVLGVLLAAVDAEASWVFRSSYYSHDPQTGQRVSQYAPPVPSYSRVGGEGYLQSVYRHNETTLRAGDGADHMHVVETWGAGDRIRPYGEWLFPYRAGATPYGPWGNPQGPWTLPFDSWSNPYGLTPRYYPGPQPTPYGQLTVPYGQQQPMAPSPNLPRIN